MAIQARGKSPAKTAKRRTSLAVALLVDDSYAVVRKDGDGIALDPHERRIQSSLRRLGFTPSVISVGDNLEALRRRLTDTQPDVVFNLVEEFAGHRQYDAMVADFVESLGFSMTGSDGAALRLCRDKGQSKAVLLAAGLTVPRFVVVRKPGDLAVGVLTGLRMPVVVKPLLLDASDFISRKSVCFSVEKAVRRADWLLRAKGEPSIIEEFVEGRELAVSMTAWHKCETWVIREMRRPEACGRWTIATSRVKDRWPAPTPQPTFVRARLSARDRARVEASCQTAFSVLGLRSYGRLDLILSARDGVPTFLEANPNCCLAPRAYGVEGPDKQRFDALVGGIVNEALQHSSIRARTFRSNFSSKAERSS